MATLTDAQKRADIKYKTQNCVQIALRFPKTTDADIIQRLSEVENKAGYIKKLIRDDIARQKQG